MLEDDELEDELLEDDEFDDELLELEEEELLEDDELVVDFGALGLWTRV